MADPVVLLHGLTASPRAWTPILGHLLPLRPFVPALPGHNGGPALPDGVPATIGSLTDAVCAQLDEAGIGRAHLVGNSLGGWIALELARRGRAVSVVALSPAGAWTSPRDVRRLVTMFKVGDRIGRTALARRLARSEFGKRLLFGSVVAHPSHLSSDDVTGIFEDMAACTVLGEMLDGVASYGPVQPFSDLPCPVVLAWSGSDKTIPYKRYGVPMLAALPGASLSRLPDVGHVPMSDNPALVARTILQAIEAAS